MPVTTSAGAGQFAAPIFLEYLQDSNKTSLRPMILQVMGEIGLDEPNPNHFVEFWLFNHPSTSDRLTFAETYQPWQNGTARYVK